MEKVKNLFSKLVTLGNQINVLHQKHSNGSANDIENGRSDDGTLCYDILHDGHESRTKQFEVGCSSMCVRYVESCTGSSTSKSDDPLRGGSNNLFDFGSGSRSSNETCSEVLDDSHSLESVFSNILSTSHNDRFNQSGGWNDVTCYDDILPDEHGPHIKQFKDCSSMHVRYEEKSTGSTTSKYDVPISAGSSDSFVSQFDLGSGSPSSNETCFDVRNNNNTGESEVQRMDYELFGFDDTIELDVVTVDYDDITERTVKSSNVSTTVSSMSDAFLASENNTKIHSTSENEDVTPSTPWKIVVNPNKACDDTNMFVPVSGPEPKQLCCIYCLNRYTKLARHLQTAHKDEEDVRRFCGLPTGTKERKKIIDMIMKKGQFKWNSDLKLNGGMLQPCRRLTKNSRRTPADYTPCPKCLGSITEKTLSHHFKKCSNNALQGERKVKQLSRAVDRRIHGDACDDLRETIFPKIQAKSIARLIRFDWLLIEFGNGLCLNYSPIFQHKMIRSKLTQAGKILIAAKSICSEITDFSSLFHVKNCNAAIEAVRKISKFDLKAKGFGSPGTATTLVTLIKAIGDLLVIEYMKLDDQAQEKNVERFLKVFAREAKIKINKLAAFTQAKTKRRRNEDIPSTEDVNRFATYLFIERDKCFAELTQGYSYENWQRLSEFTLASVLVFNRRRTGEMRNITVSDFVEREIIASYRDKLVLGALPDHTSRVIKSRMKIRGKLNREVPVLLKHSCDECIQLLIHHREDARISVKNEFLFALYSPSGEIKTVDSCVVIRTLANQCTAENPGSLRGTKLRKHLASICGTMDMSDMDVTNVAKFMGHDDQIHRDVYRHNTLHREVVQMTSILEIAQGKHNTSEETKETGDAEKETTTTTHKKRKTVAINRKKKAPKGRTQKSEKEIGRTQRMNTKRTINKIEQSPAGSCSALSEDEDSEFSDREEEEMTKTNRIITVTNKKKPNKITEKQLKKKVVVKQPKTGNNRKAKTK